MKGDPTWVCLPREARPEWWRKEFPNLKRPARRLKKALYDHPDAGTYWEQKGGARVRSVDFLPIRPEWPSCYYQPKLSSTFSKYLDDFKMAGIKSNIQEGWQLLRQGFHIKLEQRITDNGSVYLVAVKWCQLLNCRMVEWPLPWRMTWKTTSRRASPSIWRLLDLRIRSGPTQVLSYLKMGVAGGRPRGGTYSPVSAVLPHRTSRFVCPLPVG